MAKSIKEIVEDVKDLRNSLRSQKAGLSREKIYKNPVEKEWADYAREVADRTREKLNAITEELEKLRG